MTRSAARPGVCVCVCVAFIDLFVHFTAVGIFLVFVARKPMYDGFGTVYTTGTLCVVHSIIRHIYLLSRKCCHCRCAAIIVQAILLVSFISGTSTNVQL